MPAYKQFQNEMSPSEVVAAGGNHSALIGPDHLKFEHVPLLKPPWSPAPEENCGVRYLESNLFPLLLESPLWDNNPNGMNNDTLEVIVQLFGRDARGNQSNDLMLISEERSIVLSQMMWLFMRVLAKRAGWIPAGTLLPPDQAEFGYSLNWEGSYSVVVGQLIFSEDALQLGSSLQAALTRVPDKDRIPNRLKRENKYETIELCDFLFMDPEEALSGPNKGIVEAAAALLCQGPTKIISNQAPSDY